MPTFREYLQHQLPPFLYLQCSSKKGGWYVFSEPESRQLPAGAASESDAPVCLYRSGTPSCLLVLQPLRTAWSAFLAGLAALLAGAAFALDIRTRPGRLALFGKDKVQVRNLDEWTLYQSNLRFEEASPDQQNEALNHYKVGLRLFPARSQDRRQKQGAWQWLLNFVVCCAFVTLSEAMRGWYRLLLVAAFYAWFWICLRLSRKCSDVPAKNDLTGLDLS
jgi:hypothetical protein